MPPPLHVIFAAGSSGIWRIDAITAIHGETLAAAGRLTVSEALPTTGDAIWSLRGSTGHTRYSTRNELDRLAVKQEGLARASATCAALIPIRKSDAWWSLAQDERRAIMEESSRHTAIGMEYLPAISRRLHHSRELGEPFDFLTWFEFAPDHADDFNEMLKRLRATEEWRYVEREVEIRVSL